MYAALRSRPMPLALSHDDGVDTPPSMGVNGHAGNGIPIFQILSYLDFVHLHGRVVLPTKAQ
jgi:hypothetical protein